MSSKYLIQSVSNCAAAFATEQDNPQNWQATCRDLGNLLQGMGRFDEAITWHSLALESQPNLAEIYAQLGSLYAKEESWDEAIAFFNNALKSQPNSFPIYSSLAQIYGQMGNRELETECWCKAVELKPDLINAQGYYKLGMALEEQGKIDEALECYQKACDREESLLPAYYKLAEKRLQQKDLDAAKDCIEHIIQQDFAQYQAHYQLGRILACQGEFESAIAEFRQTIKLDPEFNWAYSSLIDVFLQQQKWDEAISTCHAILNLIAEFPWVYSSLGNALRGKKKISEAVAAYQKSYALRGWNECLTNNYFVPVDQFTHRIALFEKHLLPLANQENFSVLEVGSPFGINACWLLDKVLTHPSAKFTCLDNQLSKILKENIAKTGAQEKVTLQEQPISDYLGSLKPQSFDLAIFQDRRNTWESVNKNIVLLWKLVKLGGIIVFGDYGWQHPQNPEKNPQKGIDLFLNSIPSKWELIALPPRGFQLIIKKIAKSDDEE